MPLRRDKPSWRRRATRHSAGPLIAAMRLNMDEVQPLELVPLKSRLTEGKVESFHAGKAAG